MSLSDFDLFLSSMEDVTPISSDTIKPLSSSPHSSLAQQQKRQAAENTLSTDENYLSTESVELVEPFAILSFKKDGVQGPVFKNLRLAKYQVDATLDLHGQLLKNARNTLFNFINDCQQQNVRVVLIRHGVGIKNKTKPGILKSFVNKWLPELPAVLAYHTAQRHHGGSGATYVLLKKSADKKHENREIHSKR
ncbi:DNA endonuclease SmrA [Pseudoalteromonas sp. 13-15]|jgi:DNA-nicking Smr family endonuclease|uniref:DNA endonuclease SmrA n=1 Tax=Pseudoalteromonas marina TaxID=267375 RepID=A0ABT9F9F2_9GAMM|nr:MULTISPECIES: DNA endonuclease SmrA [Pseudoalteromonas]MBL1386228.1 DNA endonuclease SmrA [Colwellia sp.]AUL72185.1 DNA endonuclease SmrA [Pseudoalteromonas sp. 13-15]KTF19641.1 DNA mismatch repair protein MutS [Pseudoalteromonas sp. 10-33]MDP2484431.1 DNA endonuclease SmrA [Pseudoalteromonas marina]MDP2563413.1 DNA endonuclease SmrA [Pseudoalteromonas marina]|tara:strand:- start:146 stop:724 length:579 start_codon:yes stop_codon:yes gene_type:complete